MKSNILFFLAVITSACGSSSDITLTTPAPVVSVQPEFQSYVQAFVETAAQEGKPVTITNLIVKMTPTLDNDADAGVVGLCTQGPYTNPTIQIGQNYWDTVDNDGRQDLVFHELGHCVLNRVHRPDLDNGVQLSIMNPYVMDDPLYSDNLLQYYHELFWEQDLVSALPLINPEIEPVSVSSPTISNVTPSFISKDPVSGKTWHCASDG
jgi:hypothetical protein